MADCPVLCPEKCLPVARVEIDQSASRVQTEVPERDVREIQVLGAEKEAVAAFPKPHPFHLWLL